MALKVLKSICDRSDMKPILLQVKNKNQAFMCQRCKVQTVCFWQQLCGCSIRHSQQQKHYIWIYIGLFCTFTMHYSSKLLSLAKRVELQRVIKSHLLDKVKVLSRGLDKHLTHPLSPNHSSYQEYTLQGEGLTRLTPLNLSIGWTPASLEKWPCRSVCPL